MDGYRGYAFTGTVAIYARVLIKTTLTTRKYGVVFTGNKLISKTTSVQPNKEERILWDYDLVPVTFNESTSPLKPCFTFNSSTGTYTVPFSKLKDLNFSHIKNIYLAKLPQSVAQYYR